MHRSLRLAAFGLAVAVLSTSCDPNRPPKKHFARCAATQADQPTIVVLSQLGPQLPRADKDPARPATPEDRLVFAAWPDCAVVFREGAELRTGQVPAEKIDELLTAIGGAGFFDPPLPEGILFPDGPMQTLGVRDGAKERTLRHYGPSDAELRENVAKIGPTASPSREKQLAFMAMWDKILAAMAAAHPAGAAPYQRGRVLGLRN